MRLIKVASWERDGNDCDIKESIALIKNNNDQYIVLHNTKYSAGGWGAESEDNSQIDIDADNDEDAIKRFNELMN
jgi:hypothetical protein